MRRVDSEWSSRREGNYLGTQEAPDFVGVLAVGGARKREAALMTGLYRRRDTRWEEFERFNASRYIDNYGPNNVENEIPL